MPRGGASCGLAPTLVAPHLEGHALEHVADGSILLGAGAVKRPPRVEVAVFLAVRDDGNNLDELVFGHLQRQHLADRDEVDLATDDELACAHQAPRTDGERDVVGAVEVVLHSVGAKGL